MVPVVWLRVTVMSTMEPVLMSGGRRIDGNSIWRDNLVLDGLNVSIHGDAKAATRCAGDCNEGLTIRLSSVNSTAMPASTLPTVNETSILADVMCG